ncbi:hypothetical protein L0666_06520 [Octadecabacter sp. CECT 8868]|nr:hypothetical protein [Octadecabacter algicola]
MEPLPAGTFASPFGVRSNGVPVFECLRLLTGSLDVEHKPSSKIVKHRFCYLSQKSRRLSGNTTEKIVELAFDGDLSAIDAGTYLTRSASTNRAFWEELKTEICFCLSAKKKHRHVEAFLHLYRVFELVSVALPLIYATKVADFRDAVRFIKSLSKNERDQDLSILRYFSEEISKSGSFSDLSIDYSFDEFDASARAHLRSQLDSFVLSNANISHTGFASPNDGVSIEFKSVSSFMVSCRNRLFHNAISNENFKLDGMQGSNTICSILIDPGLYWFSLVLTEIMKAEASRYV